MGNLSFCAKAPVLDEPGACPGGQMGAEKAKVLSFDGKMMNLSISCPLSQKDGRMHRKMQSDK